MSNFDDIVVNEKTLIRVDNGEMFEGFLSHWRDVFFSNPSKQSIIEFCRRQGWKLEFCNPDNED